LLASLSGGLPDLSGPQQLLVGAGATDSIASNGCEVLFEQAQVEGIDVANRQVVISKPESATVETVDYDALVVATGAEISLDAIPGAVDYALPFYTVEQALELERILALLDRENEEIENQQLNIVIVGGGYSGVELALNLVDRFGGGDANVRVNLVHRGKTLLEYATAHNRRTGTDRLRSSGVHVMTSTSVMEIQPGETGKHPLLDKYQCRVKISKRSNDSASEEERIVPATLLLWTAGATPTPRRNTGVRNSVLPRDTMGRILTSPTLNVPRYPNVFAIGDCSRPKKELYPATAQVAIQQATVAAWNVYATLTSRTDVPTARRADTVEKSRLLPFKFLDLGEMMTLGSEDATISTLGGAVELSGSAASWLRRWIYAVRMPTPVQGLRAGLDGTGRKLARSRAGGGGGRRRSSKLVDWW